MPLSLPGVTLAEVGQAWTARGPVASMTGGCVRPAARGHDPLAKADRVGEALMAARHHRP